VPGQRGLGLVLLIIVAGLVVGSLLGELLGHLATGWLQDLLTQGPTIGVTPPVTLDLRLIALTFGVAFKVNVVGVLGIVIAALTLRRL
jgi:Domain of unknown function (DUF4321)